MSYSLSPWLKPRFFITGTNRPLAAGLLYTYKAGTTDNATTYSNDTGTTNTNPIVLDSDGQCDLYLDDSVSYRFILKNAAGVTQFDKDRIASLGSTQVQSFNSIAALRLKTGTTIANSARTLGYYAAGDGGGNNFYYDTTSTATDNGGTVIKPTSVSGAGRWLATDTSSVNIRQFGAKCDGSTSDQTAYSKAVAIGVPVVFSGNATCMVSGYTTSQPVNFQMDKNFTLKLIASSNVPIIKTTGSSLTINGGIFDGNSSSNTYAGGCIEGVGCTKVDVNTKVNNSLGDFIYLSACNNGIVNIAGNTAKRHGINVQDSSNFVINGTLSSIQSTGVLIKPSTVDCENIRVICNITDVALAGTPHCGVYFNSGDVYIVKNSYIDSRVKNCGFVGIFPGGDNNTVSAGSSATNCGNVTASGGHGLWVHDSSMITVEGGNYIGNARAGIAINKSPYITVANAFCMTNQTAGIYIDNSTSTAGRYVGNAAHTGLIITNNTCNNNSQIGANVYSGIYLDGYDTVTISNNHATDIQTTKTQSRGLVVTSHARNGNVGMIGNDFAGNLNAVGLLYNAISQISANSGNNPSDKSFLASTSSSYTDLPLKIGSYSIWISNAGKLMIKNGTPSTDTDGTVVGTQT